MFDDKIEISSDLEWLLESGQANTPSLVQALIHEHYRKVYDQALAALAYPEEARRAADEIFLTAVQQAQGYRVDAGVQTWLDGIAGQIIRKRKQQIERLSLLNPRLNQSILKREPNQKITQAQVDAVARRLLRKILKRRSRLNRRARVQEIAITCLAVLMVYGLLRVAGIFPPVANQEPATGLDLTVGMPAALSASKRAGSGHSGESLSFHPLRGIPPQAPLSINSSHDDIWRRMLLSRFYWHTLRADLVVMLYGPKGYIGPPKTERHQVWIEQDEKALLVSGEPFSSPDRVELITPSVSFPNLTGFLHGVADISRLGSQIPWFYLSEETIFSSPYLINFFFMENYDWPPSFKEFEIVREDRWVGREAVVVEQTNQRGEIEARLWLDSATGLILREQYFAPDDPEKILLETVMTAVAFNQDLPDELFAAPDNYTGWYPPGEQMTSQTFSPEGELYPWLSNQFSTEIIPKQPPTDFDPSGSQLRFLYSGDIYFGPARATEVQVLADDYTLGKIKINHLFKTACKRSPDGRLIVLFTREDPPSLLSDLLTLYNLSDLKPAPMTFPGNLLVRTAFSPDSRTLAVAGIDFNSPVSHVYLADLADGGRLELPVMEPVWSLAWRPDGRQLAALHWPSFRQSPKFAVQITVYDLDSKGLTHYIIDPDLDWGSTEAAIPLEGWVASFPLPMDGLESCSSAPGRSDLSQESPLIPSDLK